MRIEKVADLGDEGHSQHPQVLEAMAILIHQLEEIIAAARAGRLVGMVGSVVMSTEDPNMFASGELFIAAGPPNAIMSLAANYMKVGNTVGNALVRMVGGSVRESPDTSETHQ
jgi:hypothetical protein